MSGSHAIHAKTGEPLIKFFQLDSDFCFLLRFGRELVMFANRCLDDLSAVERATVECTVSAVVSNSGFASTCMEFVRLWSREHEGGDSRSRELLG